MSFLTALRQIDKTSLWTDPTGIDISSKKSFINGWCGLSTAGFVAATIYAVRSGKVRLPFKPFSFTAAAGVVCFFTVSRALLALLCKATALAKEVRKTENLIKIIPALGINEPFESIFQKIVNGTFIFNGQHILDLFESYLEDHEEDDQAVDFFVSFVMNYVPVKDCKSFFLYLKDEDRNISLRIRIAHDRVRSLNTCPCQAKHFSDAISNLDFPKVLQILDTPYLDKDGPKSPLQLAVQNGHKVIALMIRDIFLLYAVRTDKIEYAQKALEDLSDVEKVQLLYSPHSLHPQLSQQEFEHTSNYLDDAISYGRDNVALFLLQNGAKPKVINDLFTIARQKNMRQTLQYLESQRMNSIGL